MSTISSPCPSDDYILIQPSYHQNLPLRTRVTEQPTTYQSPYHFSDSEYEYINSPATVRSLNSTPSARSASAGYNVQTPRSDYSASETPSYDSEIVAPSNGTSDHNGYTANLMSRYSSLEPITLGAPSPYSYVTSSEERYSQSNGLTPSPGANYQSPEHLTFDDTSGSTLPTTISNRDEIRGGHRWMDVLIIDRLVDHACEYRLQNNLQSPITRDVILRFQMMKRIQDLPEIQPVVQTAIADPSLQQQPYHQHWTYAERINACVNVFTDVERLALWLLASEHRKQFHNNCLLLELFSKFPDFHVTGALTEDARLVAGTALNSVLSSDTFINTVHRNGELNCGTALQVSTRAKELYDNDVASNPDTFHISNDYQVPGIFQPQVLPPTAQNRSYQSLIARYSHEAVRDVFYRSFHSANPRYQTTQGSYLMTPADPDCPKPVRSPHKPCQNMRLIDYQMQLMLLEQQNRKRRAMQEAQQANSLAKLEEKHKRARRVKPETPDPEVKEEHYSS